MNKKGDYVSFYKQDKNGDLYTTRKTQNVYQYSQTFIYECLQDFENREMFHQMIKQQLEKRGLLSRISEREDVLINTFGTPNQVNQSMNDTQQPIDSGNDDQMEEEIDHQNEQFQQQVDEDQNDDIIIVNEID